MKATNYMTFISDLMRKGIDYAMERSALLGYESVEFLDEYDEKKRPIYEKYTAKEINEALGKYGLKVACYSVAINLTEPDEDTVLGFMRRHIEFAAAINSPCLHHTLAMSLSKKENDPPYEEMLERVLPIAEKIANMCDEKGIVCIYEPQGIYFNGIKGLGTFYGEIKKRCKNIGICADFGNMYFVDENAYDVISHFADDVKHVHVKDYLYTHEEIKGLKAYRSLNGCYIYDCEMGKGVVDFNRCFDVLKRSGYDGRISFEMNVDEETLKKSINYIADVVD